MGAPLELLKADVKLKEENQMLFNAIIRRLKLVIFLNSAFVILTLAVILFFFTGRPAEVARIVEEIKKEEKALRHQRELLRQDTEANRRAKDSATVERLRAERARAEFEQIEKKYK